MQTIGSNAFGKLERDPDGRLIGWHPLNDHLTDVAACFERLCGCSAIRRALECAADRPLDERDIARLTALAFLHDLGKAGSGFQAKRWPRGKAPANWPRPTGHGTEALFLFTDRLDYLLEELPVDEIGAWGDDDGVWRLLVASFSHHGRPVDTHQPDWNQAVWRPVLDRNETTLYDPAPILRQVGWQVRALIPIAFEPGGPPLPDTPAFGHLFAGLIQLADWLGSHTGLFPYSLPDEDRPGTARARADRAIATLGLDATSWQRGLAERSPSFEQVFGNPPYASQTDVAALDLGPLVILESETGSGKTEAALWRFIQLFREGLVDSLYFALPTRVAATQLHQRLARAAERLWPDDPPLLVRALPGYAAADGQEPKALPGFRVLWPDEPDDEKAHRRWAAESPKRFLAAPLAVGTIDQALFGALQVRHAHLRHALLARSLLVVDEVHASDPYMTALLERLLSAHLHCGGQALLLSATLGSSARARYLSLLGNSGYAYADPESFEQAASAPYPCIGATSGLLPVPSTAREKPLYWTLEEAQDDPACIARLAWEAAAEGAKVLVIRNTVPSAIELMRTLEAMCPDPTWLFSLRGRVTLHHSRYSRQDRPLLDAAVEACIGKDRPPGPLILVGTQTLEQSLDLDADLLVTDICPMDVLLQRIGRLHRHTRSPDQRPAAYRMPRALVLVPPDQDLSPLLHAPAHGLGRFRNGGGVYDDLRIAEATRRLIKDHPRVSIPRDNRMLVESATHPERLTLIQEELGTEWTALAQAIEGDTGAERAVAALHALRTDLPFDQQELFPTDLDIATRLGAKDRLLVFDPAPTGPFGAPLRQLPLRHHLIPQDLDPDAIPEQVTEEDGQVRFSIGGIDFNYGRYGIERNG